MLPNHAGNGGIPPFYPPNDPPIFGKNDILTPNDVEERLIEAAGFLDRHVPSGRYPFARDGPWNLIVKDGRAGAQVDGEAADYVEPESDEQVRRRTGLRSAEVDRMEEALGWVELVQPRGEMRKLIYTVCRWKGRQGARVQWLEIKQQMHSRQSPDALRVTYRRSIDRICRELANRIARENRSFMRVEPRQGPEL